MHGAKGPQGPEGIQGPPGNDGKSQYTHIRYSANANGSGMTTSPGSSTKYIGIAVTNSATAPAYGSFTWSKYVGDNGARGPQGVQGPAGANGQPTYTWVKYADTPTSGMNDFPDGKKYIGLAFNKTTATESTSYSAYQWSLMPQNIEVGGRNLLTGTSDEWTELPMGTTYYIQFEHPECILEAGNTYTFSIIVEKVSNDSIPITLTLGTGTTTYQKDIGHWNFENIPFGEKVTLTHTITESDLGNHDGIFAWRLRNESLATTIRYKEVKLEKGNIATDWTEAPEDTQAKLDEKADTDLIDNIQNQLDDFVLVEGYETEIGEINQALQDYKELIESGEVATEEAVSDIKALLDRTVAIENNLGEFTESWNFDVTEITMGEEGLFLGDNLTDMGIRISPQVGNTPPRIDFVDNGTVVAEITGQYMRINRGIFVQSATIGEHKIETIAGGHTIWQWIPS